MPAEGSAGSGLLIPPLLVGQYTGLSTADLTDEDLEYIVFESVEICICSRLCMSFMSKHHSYSIERTRGDYYLLLSS